MTTNPENLRRLKVEHRATALLTPYSRNARTHTAEQIAQIAESITQFGWTNPILVDGENGIIAGHGRLAAAKVLGMPTVPIIELRGLTPAQQRALILADNQLALNAGWDPALLGSELAEIEKEMDLAVIGFSDAEIAKALEAAGSAAVAAGNAELEWAGAGMPAFHQPDKTAFRSVVVHFVDQAAVDSFEAAIARKLGGRWLWWPEMPIERAMDKRYQQPKAQTITEAALAAAGTP